MYSSQCTRVWLCYATGGKRIFPEKLNFVGSWWSASRKSLKPHKYFVSSFRRWFVWFGLVALFADHLFLHLFFVSAFVASSRCIVTAGRELFFFNRTVAVSPFWFSRQKPFIRRSFCIVKTRRDLRWSVSTSRNVFHERCSNLGNSLFKISKLTVDKLP